MKIGNEGLSRDERLANFKHMREMAWNLKEIGKYETEFPDSRKARREFIEKNYCRLNVYGGLVATSLFSSFGLWVINHNLEGAIINLSGFYFLYQMLKTGKNFRETANLANVLRKNARRGHLGAYDESMRNKNIDYGNVDFS